MEIKPLFLYLTILILLILLTMALPNARPKDIDLSLTIGGAYDKGTWGSGVLTQPGGTHKDSWIGGNYSAQIKYHGWIFEKWQPTFEAGYRRESFDFSDSQAPIQNAKPRVFNLLFGVTHNFEIVTGYLLVGVSIYNPQPSLVEANPYSYHGREISIPDKILMFKLGAYKSWKVWKIKVGPEVSVEAFTKRPGFSRCRKFETSNFVPSAGLRIEW